MQLEEIRKSIHTGLPLPVAPERLVGLGRFLAACEEFRFLDLSHLTCARSQGVWRVLYWLRGQGPRGEILAQALTLEVRVPDEGSLPTVKKIWKIAGAHEQEVGRVSGLEFR